MQRLNPFVALQHRNYRLLWIGLLISAIGSQMQLAAVNWHIYELTRSPISLGIIGLARFLPLMFFSPISGVVADTHNRKKIMFMSQIVMTLLSGVLAFLTFTKQISPLIIYVLLIGLSAAASFDMPARQSLTPNLVPKKHLMNAVSLNVLLWQSSIVIGPSIGGLVIAALGIWPVYLFNAVSFIAVIFAIILMSPIEQTKTNKMIFNFNFYKEGIMFVRKSPIIFSTMILDFFATFFATANVLLPIFAKDILNVGPSGFGLLYAAPSIGGILAGIILSWFGKFIKNQGKVLITCVFIYGAATILFGFSKSFILSLILLSIAGAGDMISTIIRNTARQLLTPDRLRGRMVAVNMIFNTGGPHLGEIEAGLLASAVGAPASVIAGGAGTLIAVFIIAKYVPELRNYDSHELFV